MLKQLKHMLWLEMVNFYGINRVRYGKDSSDRKKSAVMGIALLLVLFSISFSIISIVYSAIHENLLTPIPGYIIAFACLLTMVFDIFKTGGTLFNKNHENIVFSIPVDKKTIVLSRILKMYFEDVLFMFFIFASGFGTYAIMLKPSLLFYLMVISLLFIAPLLPMAIAIIVGVFFSWLFARFKFKNMLSIVIMTSTTILSIFLLIKIAVKSITESEVSQEVLDAQFVDKLLSNMTSMSNKFPPAQWFGDAINTGNILKFLLVAALFVISIVLVGAIIIKLFDVLYIAIHTVKNNNHYKITKLKGESMMISMIKKEFKRYFSSSVYVTNTLVTPIIAAAVCITLYYVGIEYIEELIPLNIPLIHMAPFVLNLLLCMMVPSSVSISMEGDNWWIINTLPVKSREIINAKILMSLLLFCPFLLISEIFLFLALTPDFIDGLFLILIPLALLIYSCVIGVKINLCFPEFDWEDEVEVVKRSPTGFFGSIIGGVTGCFILGMLISLPIEYYFVFKIVSCVMISIITLSVYLSMIKIDMRKLQK